MALDTRYRPRTYDDVLGQEATVSILREYVRTGAGAHQSYLFAGAWGSGKTTLGRILARALLCSSSREGNPCDECASCRSMLETGASENFFEIDAATNSGKDNIRKIVEELQYSTFSGRRPIYLIDESHRLSRDALDALLKPMEDSVPGTEDKLLVCIFCTTEPEAMRATILSRCAPAFRIVPVSPEGIAVRLAKVCEAESIPYERDALVLIGEVTECHIRDALKAVEGMAMMPGGVTLGNVSSYLHLDYGPEIFRILGSIRTDLPDALRRTEALLSSLSPVSAYEKFVEYALMAYRSTLGPIPIPRYLDPALVASTGAAAGEALLTYADRFSRRVGRPTPATVMCDVAFLHRGYSLGSAPVLLPAPAPSPGPAVAAKPRAPEPEKPAVVDGVYLNPRAVRVRESVAPAPAPTATRPDLKATEFLRLLARRYRELKDGSSRRADVGGGGADPGG